MQDTNVLQMLIRYYDQIMGHQIDFQLYLHTLGRTDYINTKDDFEENVDSINFDLINQTQTPWDNLRHSLIYNLVENKKIFKNYIQKRVDVYLDEYEK